MKEILLALAIAHGADVGSTVYFQAHPELGIPEQNPLINRFPVKAQLPLGAAMEGTAILLGKKVLKNHPTTVKWTLVVVAGIHGGFAVNNIRLIRMAQTRNQ